jgi:DNA-binding response OmpR family regulator
METEKLDILVVDDDEDDYLIIRDMLGDIQGKDIDVSWVQTYMEARQQIEHNGWDVILVDYDLGAGNGLELIREAIENGVNVPLIMVTGRGRYELDVEAMKQGAADYITKNMLNSDLLERVIRYSLERSRSKEILEQLVEERTLELQNALEELRVTEEELRTQHEELLHINLELADEGHLNYLTRRNLPVIEVTTNEEGKIIDANPEAEQIFRMEKDALKGKLLSYFINLEDRKRFARLLVHLKEILLPRTERYRLANNSKGLGEWCLTVAPIKKGIFHTNEYYWLLHPVQDEL